MCHVCTCTLHNIYVETLGLSMELNNDILVHVQTTSLQTIARIKRVKSRLPQK
jgi:hypothetical protein